MNSTTPTLTPVKCLLVDDLEENLLALSALLRDDGVQLLTAHSGAEALELLLVHDVALALVDVQMPEMDGFELAELMRGSERTRHVPIIFVTAGAREHHRTFKGYDAGAVDFLYKPIEPHILRHKTRVFFELYRQRRELDGKVQELAETLRLSEMFMAVLGHDLRSPLTAILNTGELLRRRSEDEAVRRSADRIVKSGNRMSKMIGDMLDLARARLAGGIPIHRREADMGALLEQAIAEQQAAHTQRRLTLTRRGELTGEWDTERILQALQNLLTNALTHGAPDAAIEVRASAETPGGEVTVEVENAGEIPPDLRDQLFAPFRKREGTKAEGLGLGLYIVQQILVAHRGAVTVESGGGRTVFRLTLPRSSREAVRLT